MIFEFIPGAVIYLTCYICVIPFLVKSVPVLRYKYEKLSASNQRLLCRKIFSIFHGIYHSYSAMKIHFLENDQYCKDIWITTEKIYYGKLGLSRIIFNNYSRVYGDRYILVMVGSCL